MKIFNYLHFTLLTGACLVIVVLSVFFSKDNFLDAEEHVINNESYAKAFYLMQQGVSEVQQAEKILTNLNKEIPNNSVILNALGKALFFQYRHIEPYNKDRLSQRAKECITQAIELNPNFADAYLQLAEIALYHDNNFPLAEEYYLKAIDLSPQDAINHSAYARLLLIQGRSEKSNRHSKIAQSIDPSHYTSPVIQWSYYMAGEHELSKQELTKLYETNSDLESYHSAALNLYEALGDEENSFKYYLKKFEFVGYSEQEIIDAKNAFNQGGLKQLNYWLVNVKKEQQDIGQYFPPFSTARYHIGAGEYKQAIDLLEIAVENKEMDRVWISADPKYKPLKQFPRFIKLLKQLGFSDSSSK